MTFKVGEVWEWNGCEMHLLLEHIPDPFMTRYSENEEKCKSLWLEESRVVHARLHTSTFESGEKWRKIS